MSDSNNHGSDILSRIEEIMRENRELKERNLELEKQFALDKTEIESLRKRLAVYETNTEINGVSSMIDNADKLFAFYKLSADELSSFENKPDQVINKPSTPLIDFRVVISDGKIVIKKYIGKGGDIVIPEGIVGIGDRAFCYNAKITNVTASYGLVYIGRYGFADCTSLLKVSLPESVKCIGENAFSGCKKLKCILISNSITSIYAWAFAGCTSLTSIVIPNSVIGIGDFAFKDCINLKSIYIHSSVSSFGDYVFSNCKQLTIFCNENSEAHKYAETKGIAYELIG